MPRPERSYLFSFRDGTQKTYLGVDMAEAMLAYLHDHATARVESMRDDAPLNPTADIVSIHEQGSTGRLEASR